MPFLILVRHSAPDIDPARPSREWRLTPSGRDLARGLAGRVAELDPAIVMTSVERKARETGEIMAGELGVPCRARPGLQENDRRALEFVGEQRYRALFAEFFAAPDRLIVGRETAAAASDRFHTAVLDTVADFPDQSVALVAHGVVISLFVSRFNPIDTFEFWSGLGLPAAVILDRDGYRLDRVIGV